MFDYRTLVVREDKSADAIVIAKTQKKMSDLDFFTAVRRSITKWVKETEEGKRAFAYSSEDFNIGDLSSYTCSEELQSRLKTEGINKLDITINFVNEANVIWVYDTHLVDIEEE